MRGKYTAKRGVQIESAAHRRMMAQWEKEAVYSDSILAKSGTAATANAAYEANFVMADHALIWCYREKAILDKVIEKFKNYKAKGIVDYMHEEKAY